MKKSNFTALVMGTVSGVLFALGMCMALLPEWNLFSEGIIVGSVGILLSIITVVIWRKMEHKPPVKLNGKAAGTIIVSLIGTLVFGAGLCLCLAYGQFVWGIAAGLIGIIILLCLIPIFKGLK